MCVMWDEKKEKLLGHYLMLREPDSYQWNMSPRSLYLELETRDFFARNFVFQKGMNVCNIGIGVGEWDDYLGYLLKDFGQLTSVDMDKDICEIFSLRQQREGHLNPSYVICSDFLKCEFSLRSFDLITIIGSTLNEVGVYRKTFERVSNLLKPGGHLFYMDLHKYNAKEKLLGMLPELDMDVEVSEEYDRYPSIRFYCIKIKKK